MLRFCTILCCLLCAVTLWAADLPITDVVLYSSGVGYFQRAGSVTGDETVQLSFKLEQMNDLLKSMVLLDLDGGRVGAVTYGAKDPVSKTLQAFAVNITDNPSRGQLLNRLRGVQAQVSVDNEEVTGKILGVESKKVTVDKETHDEEILNLLTEDGLRSIPLSGISNLRLVDEKLNRELNEALAVVASGLDNQRKPVAITFTGQNTRHVLVGYLSETPIWKTTYRLVTDNKGATLQGWAVVENTSDADWTNVRLSLVSGRPISFIQDLYTPLYIPRPLIKPEIIASIRPVEYNENLNAESDATANGKTDQLQIMPHAVDGISYSIINGNQRVQVAAMTPLPPTTGVNAARVSQTFGNQRATLDQVRSTIVSAAQATDLGQAFQYAITQPVNLPRQQSALLPIVSDGVDAWKVSIYNAQVHPKFPLYGMKLKNTTGLHLMGGPITVYTDNAYAGDATIEDLQPNEQRLISYAIDLGTEISHEEKPSPNEILAFKVVKGILYVTTKYRRDIEYTVRVKDAKERTVIIEHPFNEGWKLVEPQKADERTDSLYRFTLRTEGKTPVKLGVVEEYVNPDTTRLVDLNTDSIAYYLKSQKMNGEIGAVLKQVLEMQRNIQEARRKRGEYQQQLRSIAQEQQRLRQNMSVIGKDTTLYKRYLAKLNSQETHIEQLQTGIDTLQNKEAGERKKLEAYSANLTIE